MGLFDAIKKATSEVASTVEIQPISLDATTFVPEIRELVNCEQWDTALNLASDLTSNFRSVIYDYKKPLTEDVFLRLKDSCGLSGIELKFYNDGLETSDYSNSKKLSFAAIDKDTSQKLVSILNNFDDEGILPKDRLSTYDPIDAHSAQSDIIRKFYTSKGLISKVSEDGYKWIEKFGIQLGLNEIDNPFIVFLNNWQFQPLTDDDLHALNNLYASGSIGEEEVLGNDSRRIIYNPNIYGQDWKTIEATINSLLNQ